MVIQLILYLVFTILFLFTRSSSHIFDCCISRFEATADYFSKVTDASSFSQIVGATINSTGFSFGQNAIRSDKRGRDKVRDSQ